MFLTMGLVAEIPDLEPKPKPKESTKPGPSGGKPGSPDGKGVAQRDARPAMIAQPPKVETLLHKPGKKAQSAEDDLLDDLLDIDDSLKECYGLKRGASNLFVQRLLYASCKKEVLIFVKFCEDCNREEVLGCFRMFQTQLHSKSNFR